MAAIIKSFHPSKRPSNKTSTNNLEFGAIISNQPKNTPLTGSWSVLKPMVGETCIGCGICAQNCPEQSIGIKNKKAVVNLNYCKGCGICKQVCPTKSIIMRNS